MEKHQPLTDKQEVQTTPEVWKTYKLRQVDPDELEVFKESYRDVISKRTTEMDRTSDALKKKLEAVIQKASTVNELV